MSSSTLVLGILATTLVGSSCTKAVGKHADPTFSRPSTITKREIGTPHFAYGSPAFAKFVADSYALAPGVPSFDSWLTSSYAEGKFKIPDDKTGQLIPYLRWKRDQLAAIKDKAKRAEAETQLGGWIWQLVKANIPKFSLDRGYEFTSVVKTGERQCLLQSVLVSGLLQTAGVNSGAAMVYRNIKGEESNNGHVVAVMKRSDGHDILVDCSDPEPFVRQQGLFMAEPGKSTYLYVKPQYAADNSITGYEPDYGGPALPPSSVRSLGTDFLRSQFEFYRGERSPGGFAQGPQATPEGLRQTLAHLEIARKYCPDNPLVVYLMGRIHWKLNEKDAAMEPLQTAYAMYKQYGHVPDGMLDMAQTAGIK